MTGSCRPSLPVRRLLLGLTTCVVLAVAPCAVAVASERGHHHPQHHGRGAHGVVYVSPAGHTGGSDRSCATAAFSTIQSAVNVAHPHGTVVVCAGTYTEDVVIAAPLTLRGLSGAVVHGAPSNTVMCDQLGPSGPGSAPCLAAVTIKSSWVRVSGLTVTGALGEGILATGSLAGHSIGHVVIRHNHVTGNDLGSAQAPNSTYPQCNPVGQVPGDCGEGIHLMGVFDSLVTGNLVNANSGGVLLTDEFGPTHDNRVQGNVIRDNLFDCGVTAPGHNPFALDSHGNRQPNVAGVYHNVIANNWITGNGVKGEGAGVLFANAAAGSASYDNLVIHNHIAGNELSGVTLHAHPIAQGKFEDLNGNRIINNWIGRNNTGGDPDAGVTPTTGILVFGAVPVTVTIIHNRISHNHFGIWLGVHGNVTAKLRNNRFFNVDVPVFSAP